jgi:hypothetical protein
MNKKEFWKVHFRSEAYESMYVDYFVYAKSATEAERRGKELANKEEDFKKPYCTSTEYMGHVQ